MTVKQTYYGHQTEVFVEESRPQLKRPSMYNVVLYNDDYTPMDFVIEVLQRFFMMDRVKATRIMLDVHNTGKGICGIYSRDVAETKVAQVNEYAQQNEHPLLSGLEII